MREQSSQESQNSRLSLKEKAGLLVGVTAVTAGVGAVGLAIANEMNEGLDDAQVSTSQEYAMSNTSNPGAEININRPDMGTGQKPGENQEYREWQKMMERKGQLGQNTPGELPSSLQPGSGHSTTVMVETPHN